VINFEKLAIASVIEGKIKLTDITLGDFVGKSPKFLFNLVKKYNEAYSSIPSKEVIEATINNQIEESKAKIYTGYLEGLPENIQDSTEYILDGLRTSSNIKILDNKVSVKVSIKVSASVF